MKREEKNAISMQKILDSARTEFAERGYGQSSVNTICSNGELSKGILYHYFKDKDALYLACMERCFQALTAYLSRYGTCAGGGVAQRLDAYFSARFRFFHEHPAEEALFFEAVMSPPEPLKQRLAEIRAPFDRLNIEILDSILSEATLRTDVSRQEVIDTFRDYQDFMNARSRAAAGAAIPFAEREQACKKAVLILLYGVMHPGKEQQ